MIMHKQNTATKKYPLKYKTNYPNVQRNKHR